MPTFDFTAPDGKSYSVDGPDGATPEQAFQILQQHLSPPQEGGSLGGIAKSLGTGLAQGAIGLAGLPADLAHLYADKNDPNPLGSEGIQKSIEGYTGEFHKPQGTLEETAAKIGQFAPAMIGGPETLATKALTRVAAPAVASEAAGKATEGTAAQPYAELAGALAGGAGASMAAQKFKAMAAARTAANATPSAEDLLSSGSKGFEAVKSSDAVIKPSSVEQMAKDIKTEMLNEGKHPISEGQAGVFGALDRLEAMGQSTGGVTPKDMEIIRKNLVDLKPNLLAGPTARMASEKFMDKYSNLGPSDLLNGSNPFPTLKNAIGDWAAGKRSNIVTGKADLAALNSGTAGSGANQDNNLRQAIKQLARPMNNTNVPVARKLGFNNEEIAAIKKAATGTLAGNTARYVGKAAPTGIVSAAMAGTAGHVAGGPIGAVALPVAGYIAKKIGDLSTKRAVAAIDSLVRSRSPLAAHVAAQLSPQIVGQMPAKSQRILQGLVPQMPVNQSAPASSAPSASRIRGMQAARDQALQDADRHDFMLNANVNDRGYALTPEEQNTYRDLARSARMTAASISRELERP